jgi:hypothetical protein
MFSIPFYLLFKTIPFIIEKLLFNCFRDPKLALTEEQNSKYIFFINSKSGKNMGSILMDILTRLYNVKNICDIITTDSINYLATTIKKIRNEDKVVSL